MVATVATMEKTPAESPSVFAMTVLKVTPHPGQVTFLESRAKVKVACCGRRWGKSFAEALDLLWFAFAHPGTVQFIFAPTADQARVIMEYAERLLLGSPLASRYVEKNKDGKVLRASPFPEIRLVTDARIHARTAGDTGTPARGRGADRIIYDESAFTPQRVIESVTGPYLANSSYGEQVHISTPFGRNHFQDLYDLGMAGTPGYASFKFPSHTSPYVSASFLEGERQRMTSLAYRVEYGAEFVDEQNAVFSWPLIQSCIGDCPAGRMPGHRYVLGYDPAKWQDRSGVVVLDVTSRPYRVAVITDIAGRDYLVQAPTVKALADEYARATVLMDSTSHDQMLEQLMRDGVFVAGYQFTNQSKQELINGLVIAMERGDVVIPDYPPLIEELRFYRYELTSAGNVRLGADSRHHDDLLTALALAVQAAGVNVITGHRVAVSPPRPITIDYQPR